MRNNKQYQAIADVIRAQRDATNAAFVEGTVAHSVAMATVEQLAERMCADLRARHRGDYPFRESRFMSACGFAATPALRS